MRISNSYVFNALTNQLSYNFERVYNAQSLINSGKKFLLPSDDPAAAVSAMRIRHSLKVNSYYTERQSLALPFLQTADSQLSSITGTIRNIRVDISNASNATNDRDQLAVLGQKIDKEIDAIVMAANGQYNGTYVFAGYNSTTTPFERVGDVVKYHGTNDSTQQEISKGINADIMVPGTQLFDVHSVVGTTGITSASAKLNTLMPDPGDRSFTIKVGDGDTSLPITVDYSNDSLQDVVNRINALVPDVQASVKENKGLYYLSIQSNIVGEPGKLTITDDSHGDGLLKTLKVADENGALLGTQSSYDKGLLDTLIDVKEKLLSGTLPDSDVMDKVDAAYNNILTTQANLGYEVQRIQTTQSFTQDEQFRLNDLLSNTEDIDMISAVTDLQNRQTAYQAALSTSAKVMKMSILDYM